MPAVKDFPRYTNRQTVLAGLILQSKTKTECNEYGLQQSTLKFICLNDRYKKFNPKRGTSCADFIAGDDLSRRVLCHLDFLGAQNSSFTRHGQAPGKGILEVFCQGAVFDSEFENGEITVPDIVTDGTPRTLEIRLYLRLGPQGAYHRLISKATLDYYAIDVSWEYIARDKPKTPRFAVPGDFDPDNTDLIAPIINKIEGKSDSPEWEALLEKGLTDRTTFTAVRYSDGGDIQNPTTLFVADYLPRELPFKVFNPAEPLPALTNDNYKIFYPPWIKYEIESSRFHVVRAGRYWHVQETGTVVITSPVPDPLLTVDVTE